MEEGEGPITRNFVSRVIGGELGRKRKRKEEGGRRHGVSGGSTLLHLSRCIEHLRLARHSGLIQFPLAGSDSNRGTMCRAPKS